MEHHALKPYILGIDPGSASGAMAVYNYHCHKLVKTQNLPTRPVKTPTRANPKRKRTELDLPTLAIEIDALIPKTLFAMIEDVHSMPKQGVVSTFQFGKAFGAALGILNAFYIPIFTVKPSIWKSMLNLSRDKQSSLQLATRLFPDYKEIWTNAKNHNMAEAALIAYLGERFIQPKKGTPHESTH